MASGPRRDSQGTALAALIVLQAACALFFLVDVVNDSLVLGPLVALTDPHLIVESLAVAVLVLGIVLELRLLFALLRRKARAERGLGIASGALNDLIEDYFAEWGLTAAEQDVAGFALKGMSIAEIARLRGTAEGTVKTHLNAIYRKAGVTGRSQLVSLLIEDLMSAPLIGPGHPRG